MAMISARNLSIPLLCALSLATAGCGEWRGSKEISTESGGEAVGDGPGLFTGKEGGIVIYKDPWDGTVPGGGAEE